MAKELTPIERAHKRREDRKKELKKFGEKVRAARVKKLKAKKK